MLILRKGWVILGTSMLAALGLALYVAVFGMQSNEPVGGSWELVSREYPAGSHRGSPQTLCHRLNGRNVVVDTWVSNARYYGDDCVGYETLRPLDETNRPGPRQYLAVCGDRKPTLLATEDDDTAEWILDAEGMRRSEWRYEGDRYLLRPSRRIGVEEIKKAATAQRR